EIFALIIDPFEANPFAFIVLINLDSIGFLKIFFERIKQILQENRNATSLNYRHPIRMSLFLV
ncbi:hypothetical protein, partial [Enterococcus faecium]|uniref:hypothetical protein n=1 Tax=Enterococcus faecium TaxID=1352 RepID=UPI0039FCED5F